MVTKDAQKYGKKHGKVKRYKTLTEVNLENLKTIMFKAETLTLETE